MSAPEKVWCGVCRALVPAGADGRAGLHAVARGAVCYGAGAPGFGTYPGAPLCLVCDDLALLVPDGATLACPACGKAHAGAAGPRTVGAVTYAVAAATSVLSERITLDVVEACGAVARNVRALAEQIVHLEDERRRFVLANVSLGERVAGAVLEAAQLREERDAERARADMHRDERHAAHEESVALAAQLAKARRYVAERLGHGEECPADDEPSGACNCGHGKLLELLAPKGASA